MTYDDWAARWPQAAAELAGVSTLPGPGERDGASESRAQQSVRHAAAAAGDLTWRNNVGATPSKCPHCSGKLPLVRYGLCNESPRLNKQFKSADLIGIRKVLIKPEHVGQIVGQFMSIEVKRPGWSYTGQGREAGQSRWADIINNAGGYARFSTGGYNVLD